MTKNDILVLKFVNTYFHEKSCYKSDCIQSLWSGYGEVSRYYLPKLAKSVVVKAVNPSKLSHHPRGWSGSISHQRKIDSYANELMFYKRYAQQTDDSCRVPRYLASTEQDNPSSLLVMEDLVHAGFGERCEKAALPTVKQGIRWLAYFHAKFLKQNTGKVWQCGTYWHLATRPDEFAKMQPSELKTQAGKIDATLNQAIYQTLLHGDAKLANFCFSADSKSMAGVDFQYVGRGAGIKDVMYFLGSCLESSDLEQYAESLVDDYFLLLQHAILENQIQVDFDELETEWRYLYSFAWADFHRFLMGWAAEHYKINDYMNRQTVVALAKC